ncbi:MAG TPA: CoA transferase [Candidatus Limnocylindrales bacterium]|nr:CoA transferase [Candidatus Limnocylindrales bacterium]
MTSTPSPAPNPGPLAGIRVIDCSTVLAGPYCTMVLGDLGADVIKVEPPDGDATRGWGPPWVGDESDGTRTASYFLAVNRNKRSIRLDLRRPDGAKLLGRLLEGGDVLVENFRAGGLARLGFGDDELARLHPALVHLAITGYGAAAPDPTRPGYDFVIQAESGLMSITGGPDDDGGGPTKVGVAITDVVAGLQGAVAIVAALVARQTAAGGTPTATAAPGGQRIDVSLLGSTLAVLVNQAQNAFAGPEPPRRLGNAHPNIVPYQTFDTADGAIAVAVGSERQWPRFCRALGLPALADEPRFATNGDRVANRDELVSTLAARFAERGSAEWLTALDAAEIPAGPINDIGAAFESPWAAGRTVELEHPRLGWTRQVRPPFDLAATPATVRTPPPLLGEHTDEILTELGVEAGEVERLRREGIV